jgi:FtsX-like permease family protein
LVASGVAVGTALLIGGLGIPHAIAARHARADARSPIIGEHGTANVLLYASATDSVRGEDLFRITVAAVGRAPVPPGLVRLPRPGELVVSPALGRILASPGAGLILHRLPGRIAGIIGSAGLAFPDELVAYVGVQPDVLRPRTGLGFGVQGGVPVVGFAPGPTGTVAPLGLGLKVLILLSVLSLVVPTLVFVATSTRLSAASRERRLAAVRLVGATPGEAGLLAALEGGMAAGIGVVMGLGLFFALRPVVAGLPLAGYRWFPSDIAPPVPQVAVVMVLVPVLAVVAALLGLRRLIVSPLGVARRGRVRRVGLGRLVPLAAGLAALGICWAYRSTVQRGGTGSILGFGASFALVVVGVALAAPWPAGALAAGVARSYHRVGTLLGARRLESDPGGSGRVVTAFALLVFAGGIIHALVPHGEFARGEPDIASHLRGASLVVDRLLLSPQRLDRALHDVRGVTGVAPLARVNVSIVGTSMVADCAALRVALKASFPRCAPTTAYLADDVPAGTLSVRPGQVVRMTSWPDERLRARLSLGASVERTSLGVAELSVLLMPPALLPGDIRRHLLADRVLIATDGTAAAVESVRNAVARLSPSAEVQTREQVEASALRTGRQVTALVDLAILVALGIALANLLVVSVDHVHERRRPFAVLSASGVPSGALVRSVVVEVILPMLSAVLGAAAMSIVVAVMLGKIVGSAIGIPIGQLAWLVALSLVAVATVTALTLPSIFRSAKPTALQME